MDLGVYLFSVYINGRTASTIQDRVHIFNLSMQQQCISDASVDDCEAGSAVGWLSREVPPRPGEAKLPAIVRSMAQATRHSFYK
jgi:hypothetical protein